MPPTTPSTAVPLSTSLATLATAAALLVLGAFGITDGALPELIRLEVPPTVGALLAVLAVVHHRTIQEAHAATALGAATEPAPPELLPPAEPATPPAVIANDAAAVMAAVGSLLESQRRGVLAVAQSGRHVYPDETPTAVLPRVSPEDTYPPALTPGV